MAASLSTKTLLGRSTEPQRRQLSSLSFCELLLISMRDNDMSYVLFPTFAEMLFITIGAPLILAFACVRCWCRDPRGYVEGMLTATRCVFGQHSTVSANVLAHLACWYEYVRDSEEALDAYQRMLDAVPPEQRLKAYPEIRRCMAHLHQLLGRNEEALQIHQDSVADLRKTFDNKKDTITWYRALLRLGDGYRRMSQWEEALSSYKEAQTLLQGTAWQNTMDATKSWERIASIYESQSQHKEALESLDQSLEIHLLNEGEFPRSRPLAKLYHRMGNMVGRGEGARKYWNLAKEVYGRSGKSNEDVEMVALSRKIEDSQVATAC